MKHSLFALLLLLAGCAGKPEGITPVSGFELNRYLGTWPGMKLLGSIIPLSGGWSG